ncbi:MAG: redoxin family protein [Gemmatimonadaceae bacterium]|nr:redoxin family protein [Gemmatimonadaceae bacterium]
MSLRHAKSVRHAVLAAAIFAGAISPIALRAQDAGMSKDAMQKDGMKKDGMQKDGMMQKGAMQDAGMHEMGVMVGATAPAATVRTLDGHEVDLATYYGDKPVVLEFWATWCPLCKKLEPALQAARAKYAGKVAFVGVGVSSNQSAAKQKAYVDHEKLTGAYVFDYEDAAVKAFSAPHTSYVVVINKDRKVVYTGAGPDQDIDAAVRKALQ